MKSLPEVYIKNRDVRLKVNPSITLLNNFLMNKVPIQTVCGGKANCGMCRIKVLEGNQYITPMKSPEKRRLGEELIKQGWRLSCQNHIIKDIVVEIPSMEEDLRLPSLLNKGD